MRAVRFGSSLVRGLLGVVVVALSVALMGAAAAGARGIPMQVNFTGSVRIAVDGDVYNWSDTEIGTFNAWTGRKGSYGKGGSVVFTHVGHSFNSADTVDSPPATVRIRFHRHGKTVTVNLTGATITELITAGTRRKPTDNVYVSYTGYSLS